MKNELPFEVILNLMNLYTCRSIIKCIM